MEKLRERGYAVATELLPASAFCPPKRTIRILRPARAEAAAISACPVLGYEQKKELFRPRLKGGRKGSTNHFPFCHFMQIKKLIQ